MRRKGWEVYLGSKVQQAEGEHQIRFLCQKEKANLLRKASYPPKDTSAYIRKKYYFAGTWG